MDTKSNIPTRKKIVSVDILDIDKYGYGPNGAYTRREWRNACLNHFESGFDVFMHWQKKCIDMDNKKEEISFDYELIFDDGTRELKFNNEYSPCSLDFIGQVFERLTAENYNFLTNALFDCITVRGFSNFHQCQFRECATFKGASFLQNAYFGETTFYSYLHLSDAIFYETASFTSSKFSADALFDSVEFNGPAGFENTLFSKNAWFNSVVFNDYAWFIGAHLKT